MTTLKATILQSVTYGFSWLPMDGIIHGQQFAAIQRISPVAIPCHIAQDYWCFFRQGFTCFWGRHIPLQKVNPSCAEYVQSIAHTTVTESLEYPQGSSKTRKKPWRTYLDATLFKNTGRIDAKLQVLVQSLQNGEHLCGVLTGIQARGKGETQLQVSGTQITIQTGFDGCKIDAISMCSLASTC